MGIDNKKRQMCCVGHILKDSIVFVILKLNYASSSSFKVRSFCSGFHPCEASYSEGRQGLASYSLGLRKRITWLGRMALVTDSNSFVHV